MERLTTVKMVRRLAMQARARFTHTHFSSNLFSLLLMALLYRFLDRILRVVFNILLLLLSASALIEYCFYQ